MKTASFFTYQGRGRISIARYAPRNTPAGYRTFRALAPGEWFNKVPKDRYRELYTRDVLGVLDPKTTVDALEALAGEAEPVLLCWERPPFTEDNWCHRRMVAEWFADTLGLSVPELEPAKQQTALFGGTVR
jgi:hypothetical protein